MTQGNKVIRERLRRMKEILLNDGWTKGGLVAYDDKRQVTGYCMLGAIQRATGNRYEDGQQNMRTQPEAKAAMREVTRELEATINSGRKRETDIPRWNDRKVTTLPMVVRMIDKTILRLTPQKRAKAPAPTRSTVKL